MRIIIHPGLTKTGTTTLQKQCFVRFDNTVTRYSPEKWKQTLRKKFAQMVRFREPSVWSTDEGLECAALLKKACERTGGAPLLISHETLTLPQFFEHSKRPSFSGAEQGCFPLALHVDALFKACPWISQAAFLLTLRSQPEWLASRYVQDSHFIKNASQEDFEHRVRRILLDSSLDGGGYLNWGQHVHDLASAVGKDNVSVLLLEEIKTPAYWETLAEMSELPFDPRNFVSKGDERDNVRSAGGRTWRIRKWPAVSRSRAYRRFPGWLKNRFSDRAAAGADLLWNLRRPAEITLSEELESEIREYCSPFNNLLAGWLGRDISHLGY